MAETFLVHIFRIFISKLALGSFWHQCPFFFLHESFYYSASLFLGKADGILDIVYILDSVIFPRKVLIKYCLSRQ